MDLFHKTAADHPSANPLKTKRFFAILNASPGEDAMTVVSDFVDAAKNIAGEIRLGSKSLLTSLAFTTMLTGCGENSGPGSENVTPKKDPVVVKRVLYVEADSDDYFELTGFVDPNKKLKLGANAVIKNDIGDITAAGSQLPIKYYTEAFSDNAVPGSTSDHLTSKYPNKGFFRLMAENGAILSQMTVGDTTYQFIGAEIGGKDVLVKGLKSFNDITGGTDKTFANINANSHDENVSATIRMQVLTRDPEKYRNITAPSYSLTGK